LNLSDEKWLSKQNKTRVLEDLAYAKAVGGEASSSVSLSADLLSPSTKRAENKDLEFVYNRFPLVSRAIEIRANEMMARGFEIVTDKEAVKEELMQFLEENNFSILLHQACINTDLYGNGFIEIMYNKGETDIAGLKLLHPKYIDVKRDTKTGLVLFDDMGVMQGYIQKVSTEQVELSTDQLMHFVFKRIGDEVLGHSIIEPALKTIERSMNIEEGIAQAIYRHGFPQFDISVGTENEPPNKSMIDDIATAVENLNSKNEFVHPFYEQIKVLESQTTRNFESYPQIFIKQIVSNFGVPEALILGTGESTNRATAMVQSRHFRAQIEAIQLIMKVEIEDKLFKKLKELRGWSEVPRLEWNETMPEDETDKVGRVATLFDKNIVSRNEAREMLGLPPDPFSGEEPEPDVPEEPEGPEEPGDETRGGPTVPQPDRLPKQEIVTPKKKEDDWEKRIQMSEMCNDLYKYYEELKAEKRLNKKINNKGVKK
jgi:hypothetical protein